MEKEEKKEMQDREKSWRARKARDELVHFKRNTTQPRNSLFDLIFVLRLTFLRAHAFFCLAPAGLTSNAYFLPQEMDDEEGDCRRWG